MITMGVEHSCNSTNCTDETSYVPPSGSVWVLAVTYGIISVLAVVGNTLVVVVVVRSKRMQTVTNIFIVNVAIADILTGMLSVPFQLHAVIMQVWVLPRFMCAIAPAMLVLSVSISVFTLAVIAVDRFFAVVYPMKPGTTKLTAKLIILVIWAIGVGSSAPTAIFYQVQTENNTKNGEIIEFCDANWPSDLENFGKIYHIYLFSAQYIFPLSVIVFAYTTIGVRIWLTKTPGDAMDRRDEIMNRNKRKVVKMLVIVVCLFVICWLPLQVYNLLCEIYPPVNHFRNIHIVWYVCNWLAMSNSCHNPFIYGLLNERFKNEFRRIFSCVCRCCVRPEAKQGSNGSSVYVSDDGTSRPVHKHEHTRMRRRDLRDKRDGPCITACHNTEHSYV